MKGGTLIFFRPVLAPAKGGKPYSLSNIEVEYI
jgi:hypothetical protein